MNYGKLKERIKQKYRNQREFAIAMGMSYTALNLRLNNKAAWTSVEILHACELLDIPLSESHLYFFDQKV